MQWLKSTIGISLFSILFSINAHTDQEPSFALGLNTGYNRGFGVRLKATAIQPLQSLPVQLRFGLGYRKLDPGSAADAKRIFINYAANGVPEKKAKAFDYRLDFLWSTNKLNLAEAFWILGPRYSSYTANFKYVGGNEDFDVTSKQFGMGLGVENHFSISAKLNLVAATGLDYFFDNTLQGHDTSYSPDNDNVNPRNDNQNYDVQFTYSDADEAVN